MNKLNTILLVIVAVVVAILAFSPIKPNVTVGSIGMGNEYKATTTSPTAYSFTAGIRSLTPSGETTQGTLGSLIVAGAGSAGGHIEIFDATTTNPNLRARNMASSTQLIASLPVNASAGTYTYDVYYKYGLQVVVTGTVGTTTITYR